METFMKAVQLNPLGAMSQLSQLEVEALSHKSDSTLYQVFRNCILAVLHSGAEQDDHETMFAPYHDFSVNLIRRERGVKIELVNPPADAFVDGTLIKGVHEHLFAVLRDLLHFNARYQEKRLDLSNGSHITHMVFDFLRHANVIASSDEANMVVCWGGHSINEIEYQYTKNVGYQLGLRELNICTGCGPGAMKGPMKGAAIAHVKQRFTKGRYLGITEPSIIAAEPPNAIVNELVIMPDIEKRLEAFVRMAQAIIIFPGGVGTAEEFLYILGVLLHEGNQQQVIPLILTGPSSSAAYFEALDAFIKDSLGSEVQQLYEIIIDDPAAVAKRIQTRRTEVKQYRIDTGDSFNFNWSLKIPDEFQQPFVPNHQSMSTLNLHRNQPRDALAANLRRAFSGIVSGNVKDDGIRLIREKGPFALSGDSQLMSKMDTLLASFVEQQRMKLPGSRYTPCYKIVK
jgi:predicted Rossmann-fold nucleotide-binding protein